MRHVLTQDDQGRLVVHHEQRFCRLATECEVELWEELKEAESRIVQLLQGFGGKVIKAGGPMKKKENDSLNEHATAGSPTVHPTVDDLRLATPAPSAAAMRIVQGIQDQMRASRDCFDWDDVQPIIDAEFAPQILAEREACAKIAEAWPSAMCGQLEDNPCECGIEIAAKIRARSGTT